MSAEDHELVGLVASLDLADRVVDGDGAGDDLVVEDEEGVGSREPF